ncbi:MAG TPA: prepilin-type N-terminal cleavage/methylation domain-containing protein [Woeseiaceae bacterium]
MQLTPSRVRQQGVTLVELLIGMAVGLIVIGGAIAMYVSSVHSSSETLKSSKLNQEISTLLHVIVDDVRRAGYWGTPDMDELSKNPFSQQGATALLVRDDMVNDAAQPATGQGSCLVYAYDATYLAGNVPGVIESTDLFGFRLNGSVVQMRRTGVVDGVDCIGGTCTSCTNGVWENVTDPDLIEITQLTFDLGNSKCLSGAEPNTLDDDGDGTVDDSDEYDCYLTVPANGSGVATKETRELLVTVSGRLATDPSTQATVSQSVTVRNDLLRIR